MNYQNRDKVNTVRSLSRLANPKLTNVCRMHTTKNKREIY